MTSHALIYVLLSIAFGLIAYVIRELRRRARHERKVADLERAVNG